MVVWMAGKNCMCDPVNTCHSVALRGCLGRKNALYKYLILYFTLHSSLKRAHGISQKLRETKSLLRCYLDIKTRLGGEGNAAICPLGITAVPTLATTGNARTCTSTARNRPPPSKEMLRRKINVLTHKQMWGHFSFKLSTDKRKTKRSQFSLECKYPHRQCFWDS